MTEGVNVCDFFANSGAEMWSDVVATAAWHISCELISLQPCDSKSIVAAGF